jgi:hypothetical protein
MLNTMFRGACRAAAVMAAVAACAMTLALPAVAADKQKDKAPQVPPTPPMTVYENTLGEGWENWSWAKTELGLELSGSVRKPIKVEAEGWQALYLHHAPFNTTGLRKLSFLIQGSAPDREVRVFMLTEGKPTGEGKLVKFSNTGWTKVEVPLATLGVDEKVVDGIWIQNTSDQVLPKFYVTEIKLD